MLFFQLVAGSNLWATKMLEGLKSQLVEFVMEKQSFFRPPKLSTVPILAQLVPRSQRNADTLGSGGLSVATQHHS